MARTRARGGGRASGCGGGHAVLQPKAPAKRRGTKWNEIEREDCPQVEDEISAMQTDDRVALEPNVKKAISDEVMTWMKNGQYTRSSDDRVALAPETLISNDEDIDACFYGWCLNVIAHKKRYVL
ncbi:hypothetical protein L1987_13248 [Smallanthus sonchifolius]|uniref:Uncharacterized protein n=1 Tax=Smallanthus sonchifolius TaxID=185202 RepID=A0ACB9JG11_9ASTR|nr:hypothetical protein L1987_13248 [Smallanthus sonchifolius]